MKNLLIIGIAMFFSTLCIGQCKVLDKNISGEYIGDCKKGKAHGKGKSKGKDTYEGEFSKGLPNGKGTYTWGNGDVYIGEFRKGKKDGKGKLNAKETKLDLVGYWKDDEYIGKEKFTHKILQKSAFISSVSFSRKKGANEIKFSFYKLGKIVKQSSLSLDALQGSYGNIVSNNISHTVQTVNFPLTANLKSGKHEFRFKITQAGSWNVKVNVN